jgi:hypothetical protein
LCVCVRRRVRDVRVLVCLRWTGESGGLGGNPNASSWCTVVLALALALAARPCLRAVAVLPVLSLPELDIDKLLGAL